MAGFSWVVAASCAMSALVTSSVGLWSFWRRALAPAAFSFSLLMFCSAFWNLAHLAETLSRTRDGKIFWDSLQYLPAAVAGPVTLWFASNYTGTRTGNLLRVASISAFLTGILPLSEPLHGWFRGPVARLVGSPPVLTYPFSAADIVLTVVAFTWIAIATVTVLRYLPREHPVHARQTAAIALSLALPTFGMLIGMSLGLKIDGDRDISPITSTLGALVAAWGLERQRLFDVVPVARGVVLERMPDAVLVLDGRERIVDVNPTAAALLEADPAEALGEPVRSVLMGRPGLLAALELHGEATREAYVETPGGPRWYSVVSTPLGDARARIGSAHVFRDITLQTRESVDLAESLQREVVERLQMETELGGQLRQAQKMESIGRLAGGVAHDFNNLLTAILGHAQLARGKVPSDSRAIESLDAITEAALSAADITRQLLTFSRRQQGTRETVDLAAIVARTEGLLRLMVRENVWIETRIAEAPWPVRADATQVQQALINLAVNAQDAMPAGGRLVLLIDNVTLEEADAATIPDGRAGAFVRVTVEDTGTGMGPELLGSIFEPFFTTKPEGKGTGLGLAVVHGVVHQHGGFIRVDSNPGKGTTFTLFFPRDEAPERSLQPAGFEGQRRRRAAKIIVVEDQEPVRRLVHHVLEQDGHEVRSFGLARELLGERAGFQGTPDLLLTDVVLPEMSGAALADAASCLWPSVKIIFMSGYAPEDVLAEGSVPVQRFLMKPFTPEELTRCVFEALAEDGKRNDKLYESLSEC